MTTHLQELYFKVDNFITIGSPVGLFCALRGVNPLGGRPLGSHAAGALYPGAAPTGLPVCRRMYNVFHPFDPVAYRIEPLIVGGPSVRPPELVPYVKGGRKMRSEIAAQTENLMHVPGAVKSAFTFSFGRRQDAAQAQVRWLSRWCSARPRFHRMPCGAACRQTDHARHMCATRAIALL